MGRRRAGGGAAARVARGGAGARGAALLHARGGGHGAGGARPDRAALHGAGRGVVQRAGAAGVGWEGGDARPRARSCGRGGVRCRIADADAGRLPRAVAHALGGRAPGGGELRLLRRDAERDAGFGAGGAGDGGVSLPRDPHPRGGAARTRGRRAGGALRAPADHHAHLLDRRGADAAARADAGVDGAHAARGARGGVGGLRARPGRRGAAGAPSVRDASRAGGGRPRGAGGARALGARAGAAAGAGARLRCRGRRGERVHGALRRDPSRVDGPGEGHPRRRRGGVDGRAGGAVSHHAARRRPSRAGGPHLVPLARGGGRARRDRGAPDAAVRTPRTARALGLRRRAPRQAGGDGGAGGDRRAQPLPAGPAPPGGGGTPLPAPCRRVGARGDIAGPARGGAAGLRPGAAPRSPDGRAPSTCGDEL